MGVSMSMQGTSAPTQRCDTAIDSAIATSPTSRVALAAGAGVLVEGVYRGNLLVRAGWLGNDLVTLAAALPLLAIATARARRGSPRAALAWSGVAAFTLYDYAFYLYMPALSTAAVAQFV